MTQRPPRPRPLFARSVPGAGNDCWFGAATIAEPFAGARETGTACTGETSGAFKPSCRAVMAAAPMTVMDTARCSHAHALDRRCVAGRVELCSGGAGAAMLTTGSFQLGPEWQFPPCMRRSPVLLACLSNRARWFRRKQSAPWRSKLASGLGGRGPAVRWDGKRSSGSS
jgi:hypothetical protein